MPDGSSFGTPTAFERFDRLTVEARSALMARIKAKDTTPERRVRSLLHGMGYRFRLHARDLPGTPDVVLRPRRKAVFVHGCFWHRHAGCAGATVPRTRPEFWSAKFSRNVRRDARTRRALNRAGWSVCVVWECQVAAARRDPGPLKARLRRFLEG